MATSYGTVNERSAGARFTIQPTDADGNPLTPTTARYTIHDVRSGQEVRPSTDLTPAASMTITLQADDTAMVDERNVKEARLITVTLDADLSTERNEELLFYVRNLRHVTAP